MQIYNVGPDVLDDYDFDSLNRDAFEWFVYHYEADTYEGGGYGVALRKEDGLLSHSSLGHCSCYGPIDGNWAESRTCTAEEFLAISSDSIFDDVPHAAVKAKVRELLG